MILLSIPLGLVIGARLAEWFFEYVPVYWAWWFWQNTWSIANAATFATLVALLVWSWLKLRHKELNQYGLSNIMEV